MRLHPDIFTRQDLTILSAVAGTALAAGAGLGMWLTLPSYLSAPAAASEDAGPAGQVDPNLAQYRQMAAANGVGPAPYLLSAAYAPTAGPTTAEAPVDADRSGGR